MNASVSKLKSSDIIPKWKTNKENNTSTSEVKENGELEIQNGASAEVKGDEEDPLYIITLSGRNHTNICAC